MNIKAGLVMRSASMAIAALFLFSSTAAAQDKAGQIDGLMKIYADYGKFNGTVLVAENGKVIYKKGFGQANMEWNIPNGPDTKFRLGSVTKQFTSMLVLQLVAEGKLSLQGRLSDILPDYREDTGKRITIHNLLTHTSGIPNYTDLPNFEGEVSRTPYSVGAFMKGFCSGDLEFEPGSKYRYSNSGYFILGAIIEKVTGKPYEKVLEERILKPLGMKNTGYDHSAAIIPDRAAGYEQSLEGYVNTPYIDMSLPYAAGSLYSTVEDLYIWDQALYTDRLLPAGMKELLFKEHFKNSPDSGYGYGWVVARMKMPRSKREVRCVLHGGGINGFITLIERFVDDRHLIVLLNNTGSANLGEMGTAIARILYGEPYDQPRRSIALTLYGTMRDKGTEAAMARYREIKKAGAKDYDDPRPTDLDRLGYALLQAERTEDAIKIFQLNIESYPENANCYDSLAEACAARGDKALAIKNYARSLELDPANANAVKQLNKLIKEK